MAKKKTPKNNAMTTPCSVSSLPASPLPLPCVEGQRVGFFDVLDGMSNTSFAVQSADGVPWTQPADLPHSSDKPLPRLGDGAASGGLMAILCDGAVIHVRGVNETSVRAAITANGLERLGLPD